MNPLSVLRQGEDNRFGSVAAQMQATFYGLHGGCVDNELRNMVPSIGLGFGEEQLGERRIKGFCAMLA